MTTALEPNPYSVKQAECFHVSLFTLTHFIKLQMIIFMHIYDHVSNTRGTL